MQSLKEAFKEYFTDPKLRPPLPLMISSGLFGTGLGMIWMSHIGWWAIPIGAVLATMLLFIWDMSGYRRGYGQGIKKAAEYNNLVERFETAHQNITITLERLATGNFYDHDVEDLPDEDFDVQTN